MSVIKEIRLSWKDILITSIKSYAIFLFSTLLFPFAVILIPSFFVELGVNKGWKENILANITFATLIAVSYGVRVGGAVLLFTSLLTLSMQRLLEDRLTSGQTIFSATAILTFFMVLTAGMLRVFSHINIALQIKNVLNQNVEFMVKLIQDNGFTGGTVHLDQLKDQLLQLNHRIIVLLPAIVLIGCFLFSFITYLRVAPRLFQAKAWNTNYKFHMFRLQKTFGIFAVFVFAVAALLVYTKVPYAKEFWINIEAFLSFLFMINGLSFVDHLSIGRLNPILRWMIPIIVIVVLSGGIIYSVIGLVDSLFDMRRRIRI